MSERRYTEDEVAEIFERATETQKLSVRPSRPAEGLTLAELQEIGREVGLSPDLVSHAARSLETARAEVPTTRVLGLPIRVRHTVQLPRRLTETEWEQLVVVLRGTFDARGKLSSDGAFKQWTNGNLEILLEPTPVGHQLRMRTYKESATGMLAGGGTLLAVTLVMLVRALMVGDAADRITGFATLFAVAFGLLGTAAVQLPGWATTRARQMQEIAERAALMASQPPAEDATPRNPGSS